MKIRYSRWGHPKQNFRQAHVPGGHLRGLLGPKLVPKGHLKTIPMPAGGGKGKQRASAAGNGKEQASGAAALLAAVGHGTVPARPGATGTGSSSKKSARPSGYGVAELSDDEAPVSRHNDAAQPAAGARKTSRVERQMQELADARRVERTQYTAALDAVQPSVQDPLAEGYHASMRLVAQTLVQQFVWDQLMYGTSTVYDTSKHRDAAQVGLFRLQNVHNSVQYMLHGPNFQHKLASTERPGTWERQGRPHAEHGKAEWLDDAAQMALECSGWDAITTQMKVSHTWNAKPADVVLKTTDTGAARSKWHVYLAAALHQKHALGTVRLLLPISVSPCRKTCILLPIWMSTMPIEPIVHVRLAIALVLAGWSGTFSPTSMCDIHILQ